MSASKESYCALFRVFWLSIGATFSSLTADERVLRLRGVDGSSSSKKCKR